MEKKEFNSKDFKKSIDKIAIIFLLIGAIGLASIICAFAVGGGIFPSRGKDPKDYYGTYYSWSNNVMYSFDFLEDETCIVTESDGTDWGANYNEKTLEFEYVSSQYAQTKVSTPDPEYSDCDAILIYTDESKNQAITLWVVSTDPYSFVIDKTGASVTSEELDFNVLMDDPQDYYDIYTYGNSNYVSFDNEYCATLCIDGDVAEYYYEFVNNSWLNTYTNYDYDQALILYQYGSNEFQIFEYINKTELIYADSYSFTGSGSSSNDDTSGGNTSGGNTSGGNTSGGNTSGDNTSGGNTSGGNTSGDNTSGGNTSGGNTSGGNTSGIHPLTSYYSAYSALSDAYEYADYYYESYISAYFVFACESYDDDSPVIIILYFDNISDAESFYDDSLASEGWEIYENIVWISYDDEALRIASGS